MNELGIVQPRPGALKGWAKLTLRLFRVQGDPAQKGKLFCNPWIEESKSVKEAELAALWGNEKPDQAAIQAKQKELNALRDQMQEKMTVLEFEVKKVAPEFKMGKGMDMGQGAGMGMGRGPSGGTAPKEAPAAPPAKWPGMQKLS